MYCFICTKILKLELTELDCCGLLDMAGKKSQTFSYDNKYAII